MKKINILLAGIAIMAGWSMVGCNSKSQSENTETVHELQPGDDIKTVDVDKVTIIDFNATWCGPCKQFAPHFLAGAEKYNGKALFYSVDIDNNPEFAQQFSIRAIPTVVIINPNGDIDTSVGFLEKDEFFDLIEKSIEKASKK